MTLVWAYPAVLALLPLALLPLWSWRRRSLPVSSLVPYRGGESWRTRLARLHPPFAALLLVLLVLLLAGPILRDSEQVSVRQGVDLMLALDISASMRAEDMQPNRMAVARQAAAEFVLARENDRIGVILFAGTPFLLTPPTTDRRRVAARLRAVTAEVRGTGTAIGDALAAALQRLERSTAESRAIILLTDGHSNRGRIAPSTASEAARALGVRIYTIGFGTREGAPVRFRAGGPPPPGHPTSGLLVTLDEEPLRRIAEATGGRYFRATGADSLHRVYDQIDRLETSPLEIRERVHDRPLADRLRPLLGWLLIGELLLFRGWLRRLP
ncbi:Ca-activated chloride channel family protein [Geothermobacter ehrlichii]|uniref:Ca-activated chloride channel family protein n=1 Tax=Geothermobacter ehrlichii TaxID=213224 RepID=A0A5D3WHK7_9BACT|nr:VWA domain-containing protein [Geothermobacter ehrlichii]TYO98276.1 Ca-activated chloride channel family protein [Geothermobacter ehrlichii]